MSLADPWPLLKRSYGRERLVVLSAEEYQRLKQRDRSVLSVDQLSEADLAAILQATPPPEAQAFNDEVAS